MPRKAILLKSLTRGRIRASMNKYNLFNLYKKSKPDFRSMTLYQQKWLAKTETRGYHGEHLTESRWQVNFTPNLSSVAQLDSIEKTTKGETIPKTPIQLQTFAVLEKRLDFALFRAMFASSIRQARQFILHGNVKVNGVKIKSPGYELKAGDVFSCNPEKVLVALGREKPDFKTSAKITNKQVAKWNVFVKEVLNNPSKANEYVKKFLNNLEESERTKLLKTFEKSNVSTRENIILDALAIGVHNEELTRKALQEASKKSAESKPAEEVAKEAKAVEEQVSNELPASIYSSKYGSNQAITNKLLDVYKIIIKEVYKNEPQALFGKKRTELEKIVNDLLAQNSKPVRNIKQLSSEIHRSLTDPDVIEKQSESKSDIPEALKMDILKKLSKNRHQTLPLRDILASEDLTEVEKKTKIHLPFQKHFYGRQNPNKPYFTPWQPRPFLAPFAILPHHLEISFATCHAVYLRDPVARPGESEVITPFDISIHERAYMYYARKGK